MVPTGAQSHMCSASGVAWRTQPPDSGLSELRLGLDRLAVDLRDLVEADVVAVGADGEAHHVRQQIAGFLMLHVKLERENTLYVPGSAGSR